MPALPQAPSSVSEVDSAPVNTVLTLDPGVIVVQGLVLPTSITIPNISLLILDTFDSVVAPTISDPNPKLRALRVVISRQILSNALLQIFSSLSSPLTHVTIDDIVSIAIHALNLSGIEI